MCVCVCVGFSCGDDEVAASDVGVWKEGLVESNAPRQARLCVGDKRRWSGFEQGVKWERNKKQEKACEQVQTSFFFLLWARCVHQVMIIECPDDK